MKLKTIINSIRLRINDTDAYRWSDDDVITVVNEAVRFIRNVFIEHMPSLVAEMPITGTLEKGQNKIELPYAVIKYIDVRCDDKALHATSLHFVESLSERGKPEVFIPFRNKELCVYPIPKDTCRYRIVAVRAAEELGAEDEPPFTDDFIDSVIEYASMRLSMIDEFDAAAEAQLLSEIRAHVIGKLQDYAPQEHFVRGYY